MKFVLCLGLLIAPLFLLFAQDSPLPVTYEWDVTEEGRTEIQIGESVQFTGFTEKASFEFRHKNDQTEIRQYSPEYKFILTKEEADKFDQNTDIWIIEFPANRTRLRMQVSIEKEPEEETNPTILLPSEKYILWDAIELNKQIRKKGFVRNVLKKYKIDSLNKLNANPYLKSLISAEIFKEDDGKRAINFSDEEALGSSSLLSSIAGMDVTTYVDGLARFLVKRTKEELSAAFFQDFQDAIEKNQDLKTLFPSTAESLGSIGKQIYQYQRYIITLREQFHEDLQLLPENFRKLIEQNYSSQFPPNSVPRALALTGLDILEGIRTEQHPGEIIKDLNTQVFNGYNQTVEASLQTLQLLSESFKAPDPQGDNQYWIDPIEIRSALRNDSVLQIYLGLLLEKARQSDITFADGKRLDDRLGAFQSNYKQIRSQLETLVHHGQILQNLIDLGKQRKEDISPENISRYLHSLNEILSSGYLFADHLNLIPPGANNSLQQLLSIIELSTNLYSNIVNKRYGAAITNLINLYDNAVVENLTSATEANKVLVLIRKYGLFMAALLSAETSEEVANVIEVFALPPGSSQVKRLSRWNITLNAYIGPYVGMEYRTISDLQNDISSDIDSLRAWGITAPVGVAVSLGRLGSKCPSSLSLFFSVIDIGAVTRFRFQDTDSIGQPASIYLKEIIAPGIYMSWGLPKIPVSLNAGIQQTALLQAVGVNGNTINLTQNIRLSASLVIDIPLLNLFTKEGKL